MEVSKSVHLTKVIIRYQGKGTSSDPDRLATALVAIAREQPALIGCASEVVKLEGDHLESSFITPLKLISLSPLSPNTPNNKRLVQTSEYWKMEICLCRVVESQIISWRNLLDYF